MIITKHIEWDMGHRLLHHSSKCHNLHGHRYLLEASLQGNIQTTYGNSSEGMVLDFSEIKQILTEEVYTRLDHGFLIWEQDTDLLDFFNNHSDLKYVVVPFTSTAENIAQWIFDLLTNIFQEQYGEHLTLYRIRLWETPHSSVEVTQSL